MWYIPAMATNDFIVGVTSMKFGENAGSAVELLKFKSGKKICNMPPEVIGINNNVSPLKLLVYLADLTLLAEALA